MARSHRSTRWFAACAIVIVASCSSSNDLTVQRADEIPNSPSPSSTGSPTTDAPSTLPAPSTTTSTPSPPPIADIIDPAEDLFAAQRSAPLLPAAPTQQWTVRSPRSTISASALVDETLVYVAISPANEHSVIGRDASTGKIVWTFELDDHRVESLRAADGTIIITWIVPPNSITTMGVDARTGTERWRREHTGGGRLTPWLGILQIFEDGQFLLVDPDTGAEIGRYNNAGTSINGVVQASASTLTELDPATLSPLADPVPLPFDVGDLESLVMLDELIVLVEESVLYVVNRLGDIVNQVETSSIESPYLVPIRRGTSLIGIDFLGEFGVIDVITSEVAWARVGFVQRYGLIDDEMHGLYSSSGETELISMETGATRCVFDVAVGPARNGFFGGDTAFDTNCDPIWSLPADEAATTERLDGGLFRWKRVGDDVELGFFA